VYSFCMTTVAQQADVFLANLQTRRRNPVKPATMKSYGSYLRNWIVPELGSYELGHIENGVVKKFVNLLVDAHLKPATVQGAVSTLKLLVGSEIDENGNKLHTREWNSSFLDMPPVDPASQKAPAVSTRTINSALRGESVPHAYKVYYALQAGSGLRMGEMLALRMGPDDGVRSFLDLEKSIAFVRSTIYDRVEQSTKSESGTREVDLCSTLVKWLKEQYADRKPGDYLFQTRKQTLWHVANMYDRFAEDGIPGSHSLRRFRTTHLENLSVPRVLVDYWTGHVGKAITDRYTKLGQSVNARNNWCRRAGLGFQLPGDDAVENAVYEDTEMEEGL
jgi:integrase-like protein